VVQLHLLQPQPQPHFVVPLVARCDAFFVAFVLIPKSRRLTCRLPATISSAVFVACFVIGTWSDYEWNVTYFTT
jgi:hypothetical protein